MKHIPSDRIDKLLAELQELIPDVELGDEWREFITAFVAARPDGTLNAKFKRELRHAIEQKIYSSNNSMKTHTTNSSWHRPLFGFVSGIALASIVILPIVQRSDAPSLTTQKAMQKNAVSEMAAPEMAMDMAVADTDESAVTTANNLVSIEQSEDNAFGTLEMPETVTNTDEAMAAGRGGGMASSEMMIAPPYFGNRVNFEYEYTASFLPTAEGNVAVYKKTSDLSQNLPLSVLGNVDLGLVDLDQFRDLTVQNLSLKENVDELAYLVNINLQNQNIHIHEDYQSWRPLLESRIGYPRPSLKKEDLPADSEIIALADGFLQKYGIDRSNLGTPFVRKYWEEHQSEMMGEEMIHIPDMLPVVYPYLIQGETVYNSNNTPQGLEVNVNVRHKKATGANIQGLTLQQSNYPAMSSQEVLEMAQSGGYHGIRYNNPEDTVTIKLGPVQKRLVHIHRHVNNKSEEYFVPMLVFPVMDKPEQYRWNVPDHIIVPMARDLFKKR